MSVPRTLFFFPEASFESSHVANCAAPVTSGPLAGVVEPRGAGGGGGSRRLHLSPFYTRLCAPRGPFLFAPRVPCLTVVPESDRGRKL